MKVNLHFQIRVTIIIFIKYKTWPKSKGIVNTSILYFQMILQKYENNVNIEK